MAFIDFNFYDENSYSTSWADKSFPTIIGIMFGFLFNRGYEFWKEKKETRKSGEQFINELELFQEPLKKQIASLDELINELNNPASNSAILVRNIPIETQRFESIDRLKVYRYFETAIAKNKKEARKIVNKLYGTLKVCSDESDRLKILFDDFLRERRTYSRNFNDSINDLLGNFSDLIVGIEKKTDSKNDDKLYSSLLPIFEIIRSEASNLNLPQIIERVCTPLAQITAQHRHDERASPFSNNNRSCFRWYREYTATANTIAYDVKIIRSTLFDLEVQLEDILKTYFLNSEKRRGTAIKFNLK